MLNVIVCDPDCKVVEGRATGFFYTMISCATTLANADGRNTAFYFIGPHLTKERIQQISLKTNSNQMLINGHRRSVWVAHLENNIIDTTTLDLAHMREVFLWAAGRISYTFPEQIITLQREGSCQTKTQTA
jgi:hypothetical protein